MTAATVLAVDVGGTKLAAGIVTAEGALLRSATSPTPRTDDPEVLLATLLELALELRPEGVRGLGVGCGGPMLPGGQTVSPLNIPAWRDFPLRSRLERSFDLPVAVDGDAKALAVGEGWKGAATRCSSFLAMVVSTGVGGGLVVDGRLLHGASTNAGHVGHVVVVPGGATCGCGATGCLEAEISGTAIARRIAAPAQQAPPEEVERAGRLLGEGLARVVNLLDLELVAVGGSVALGFGAPFFVACRQALRASSRLSFTQACRVVPVGLGKDGPLVGAGALAWQLLGEDVGTR